MQNLENQTIEIDLLLESIWRKYGYDFRQYARASVERRVLQRLERSGLSSILEMAHKVLEDRSFFETLLGDLSINVTEMFRYPPFYRTFRARVIPYLRTHPFLRIWVPGCSTGEEVYSIAIILKEAGLLERSQIYATDFNETIIEKAKEGIYSMELIKQYTTNYLHAGGTQDFSNYYTARYDSAILDSSLKSNIIFSAHNLSTDSVFNEMQLVSCRNVLIYFDKKLKARVFRLFRDSLCHSGLLCLGSKENLRSSDIYNEFNVFARDEKIYQKK